MKKRISGEQLRKSLKLNTNLINDEYFIFKLCNGCILCTHIESWNHKQYHRIYGHSLKFVWYKHRYYAFATSKGFESSDIDFAYNITKRQYESIVVYLGEQNKKIFDYIKLQPKFIGKDDDVRYMLINGICFYIIPHGFKNNPDYNKPQPKFGKYQFGKSKYIYYSKFAIALIRPNNYWNWSYYPPEVDNELGEHKTIKPGRLYSDEDFKEISLRACCHIVINIATALDEVSKRIKGLID